MVASCLLCVIIAMLLLCLIMPSHFQSLSTALLVMGCNFLMHLFAKQEGTNGLGVQQTAQTECKEEATSFCTHFRLSARNITMTTIPIIDVAILYISSNDQQHQPSFNQPRNILIACWTSLIKTVEWICMIVAVGNFTREA